MSVAGTWNPGLRMPTLDHDRPEPAIHHATYQLVTCGDEPPTVLEDPSYPLLV